MKQEIRTELRREFRGEFIKEKDILWKVCFDLRSRNDSTYLTMKDMRTQINKIYEIDRGYAQITRQRVEELERINNVRGVHHNPKQYRRGYNTWGGRIDRRTCLYCIQGGPLPCPWRGCHKCGSNLHCLAGCYQCTACCGWGHDANSCKRYQRQRYPQGRFERGLYA